VSDCFSHLVVFVWVCFVLKWIPMLCPYNYRLFLYFWWTVLSLPNSMNLKIVFFLIFESRCNENLVLKNRVFLFNSTYLFGYIVYMSDISFCIWLIFRNIYFMLIIWLSVIYELSEDVWFKDVLYKDVLFEVVWFKDVLYKDVIYMSCYMLHLLLLLLLTINVIKL
jgi:hypothetical protein